MSWLLGGWRLPTLLFSTLSLAALVVSLRLGDAFASSAWASLLGFWIGTFVWRRRLDEALALANKATALAEEQRAVLEAFVNEVVRLHKQGAMPGVSLDVAKPNGAKAN